MSVRKSISFSEDEKSLLEYFEENGQSKIVKIALQFYRDNKDKIFINNIGELAQLINNKQTEPQSNKIRSKLFK